MEFQLDRKYVSIFKNGLVHSFQCNGRRAVCVRVSLFIGNSMYAHVQKPAQFLSP